MFTKTFLLSTLAVLALAAPAPQDTDVPPVDLPTPVGIAVHPNGDVGFCMDVQGNNRADGTAVQLYECNGSGAQKWVFSRGTGQVRLEGSNFCLDAGWAGDGARTTIQTCRAGASAQQFTYTGDDTLHIGGTGNVCLDLTDGNKANGTPLQMWTCFDGSANQKWTTNMLLARKLRFAREQ